MLSAALWFFNCCIIQITLFYTERPVFLKIKKRWENLKTVKIKNRL